MDITPDIKIPLKEFNQHTKRRALAVLEQAGVSSLDAVGAAFWADILFVTGRERASLGPEQLEALGKASAGLGYTATQYALLSDVGAVGSLEASSNTTKAEAALYQSQHPQRLEQLNAYVQALGVDTLVFLEVETAQKLQDFSHSILGTQTYINTVVVTDFFASLEASDQQQAKKKQAWQELQPARRQTAMR